MKEFVKPTIVGGLLFFLPVTLVLFFLGYAVGLLTSVIQWFSTSFQLGHLGAVGAAILAILVLVLISLVAGVVARTEAGRRITSWFEEHSPRRRPAVPTG
jgi:uncharacterized membrane protein